MNLQQILLVLRARYKIALFALVGTVTVTLAVSLLRALRRAFDLTPVVAGRVRRCGGQCLR